MASVAMDEQPSSMIDQEDDSTSSNSDQNKENSASPEESAPTLGKGFFKAACLLFLVVDNFDLVQFS